VVGGARVKSSEDLLYGYREDGAEMGKRTIVWSPALEAAMEKGPIPNIVAP
jgi:hypothetical protein